LIPPDIWRSTFQAEGSAKALGLESLKSRDYSREARVPGAKSRSKWKIVSTQLTRRINNPGTC